jgi:RNA polymerase sigma-70 factor (ECF subfamily)
LIQIVKVKTAAVDGRGQSDLFPSTHWSVVLAAARSQAEPEIAEAALAELCQTYWPPLYSFVRSRGYTMHDAQDLTQSFFAYLIEHETYALTDRQRGRFRSFLLASLKNFLADSRDRERALKRGGACAFLPLHEQQVENAESLFQTQGAAPNENWLFDHSWAEAVLDAALKRLAAHYKSESREKLFSELRIFLTGGASPLPAYSELAERLGMTESTIRSYVTRLRDRYRQELRAEVRRTVNTEAEVDEELHDLFRLLTAA